MLKDPGASHTKTAMNLNGKYLWHFSGWEFYQIIILKWRWQRWLIKNECNWQWSKHILMLDLSFYSKKSELEMWKYLYWSAIEPKAHHQQLSKQWILKTNLKGMESTAPCMRQFKEAPLRVWDCWLRFRLILIFKIVLVKDAKSNRDDISFYLYVMCT